MNFPYLVTTVMTGYLIYITDEETDMDEVKLSQPQLIQTGLSPRTSHLGGDPSTLRSCLLSQSPSRDLTVVDAASCPRAAFPQGGSRHVEHYDLQPVHFSSLLPPSSPGPLMALRTMGNSGQLLLTV